ncbi:MAG TPA: MobF family relaxase [Gemmataceae bacterium]|nr:MobF family relaxase [Gemmataceae bacterium]
MLNFTVLKSSADMKKYYAPTGRDYFIEDEKTVAFFGGKLAERLGVGEQFDLDTFHDLCDGFRPGVWEPDPETGEIKKAKLTPGRRDDSRAGWDVTVDGPKDLGVLMALGLDERIVPEVLQRAGQDVMALIELDAKTRVRIGKQDTDRATGEIVYTGVLHTTSRPVGDKIDVQPHFHFLVANATWDPVEQRYKALQLQPFAQNGARIDRPYYTAFFNAQMAKYMKELGYQIEQTKDTFRVVGVPEPVRREFSQRTQKIEAVAAMLEKNKQEFLNDPNAKLNPAVKGRLGAHTREAKKPGKTWESLMDHWVSRVTDTELQQVRDAVDLSRQGPKGMEAIRENARESVDFALRHLLERSSTVTQREVETVAMRHGIGNVTPESVVEEINTRRDLIRREIGGVNLVTTQAVLNEEKAIVEFAQKGKGRWRPLSASTARTGGDKSELITLSPTQASAVKHAWDSRDQLIMIRGAAGTGKTTLTKALLASVDAPYVVLAPSAEASRGVLRRENVDPNADTLAKFLGDDEMQARVRGGLIVLDEASLTGAHDLAKLLKSADSLKARVLLLGDRRQHKSVARGDVLTLLEDKAKLKVATVGEIRRQSGEYKAAVKLASDGKVADAFAKLDRLGWIKEGHDVLVEDYMAGVKEGKSQLVIAPTHAEGDTVTAKLRERLKAEGVIHGPEKEITRLENVSLTEAEKGNAETLRAHAGETAQYVRHGKSARAGDRVTITAENAEALAKEGGRFVVYKPVEMKLAAGDTVRMTGNGWDVTGSHRLNNGAVYGVAAVTDAGVTLDNGWMIDTPHLQHGLVVTSHAAQGRTVDRVLVAQSSQSFPASDKAQFYVSVSRGRQQAQIYTDDKAALLEAVDRDRTRLLASELVRVPKRNLRKKHKRALDRIRDLWNSIRREPEREARKDVERQRE